LLVFNYFHYETDETERLADASELRHRRLSAILAGVNKSFPTLVELVKDNGTIGQELRKYPNWFLHAADKDAEWKTCRSG
jgi:hypothetical protein